MTPGDSAPLGFTHLDPLSHDLSACYPELRAIKKRKALLTSELWARIGGEVERVVGGVERGEHARASGTPLTAGTLRVVSWNIQRGTRFAELLHALKSDPLLARADVLFLIEVDQGLGRSGNRLVARELADALGLHYAFCPSYLTLEDDLGENRDGVHNTLALAGNAILSRVPIARVENVDLPELRDKFSSSEKRLGKKRALLAELTLPDGPLALAGCHLDSTASPAQRAVQLRFLLDRADAWASQRTLVCGDFNTSTYDHASTFALVRDVIHKLLFVGFRRTVERYMEPQLHQERPVFDALAAHGYQTDGFNDRERGSYVYDLNSAYAIDKIRHELGGALLWLLQYRLRPWGGLVPARLDWFAGRNLQPRFAKVVAPIGRDGIPVSDHAAIVVDLVVPAT